MLCPDSNADFIQCLHTYIFVCIKSVRVFKIIVFSEIEQIAKFGLT